MAKKKQPTKKNKTSFEKGHKKSVGFGRPTMTPEQKARAVTTRTQFKDLLNTYMTLTPLELTEALTDPNKTVLEISVIRHLIEQSGNGSMDRVDWSLNHVMGKPAAKSEVKFSGEVQQTQKVDLSKLSMEELAALKNIAEKSDS